MNDLEARQWLHDNVYSEAFRQKCASLGMTFDSVEEEALAQATALRLKSAIALQKQASVAQQPNPKLAMYANMNKMAGNVLGDAQYAQRQQFAQLLSNPTMAQCLDSVDL